MTGAPRSPRVTPTAFARGMRTFLVVFNLLIVGLAVWVLAQSHHQSVERAEATTYNLAQVLEQNVVGTIQRIDLVLQAIRDEVERTPKGPSPRDLDPFIQARFARVGILSSLQATDPEGRVRQGTPAGVVPDPARQEFFQRLQQDPQAGLYISRPLRSATGGAWNIALARRINGPEGQFSGVVLATLPTDQLALAMSLVDVGPKGSVSLRGKDLSLLVRYPAFRGQEDLTGSTQVFGDYLEAVRSGRPMVHFTAASRLDGQRRTYTLRRTGNPEFLVLVGLAEADYLRAWRQEATFAAAAVLGLVGLTVAMGWLARSAWLRQLSDQERLSREEAKYRLLAEHALDVIWSTDPEGRLTYISPSIQRQRGWTAEEFIHTGLEDRIHRAEDAQRIKARIATARDLPHGHPARVEETIEVGLRHKDGHDIQAEIRSHVVWGEDGQVIGLHGVTRDITERKRMEAERDGLIRELTLALAEVRNLKGMLPICGHCKKIRDDHGYWKHLESYISEHTEATFTHGVCPDCAQAFRREMQSRRDQQDGGEDS